MAVAFLAVAAGATCVPLNPTYRQAEFQQYFAALKVTVLITLAGLDMPALAAAQACHIPVITLSPCSEDEAGLFTLSGHTQRCPVSDGLAQPDDVALVLHTSGTTSQPRLVPLTQTNICASAAYTCAAVALHETDRCLNVMPLFHAAGLVTTTLATMMAGGSIVCTPGFILQHFFAWLAEFQPTWYPAVPPMHQAILEQAAGHHDTLARCPLRFVRSSTAPLPTSLLTALESVLRVPVIEGYGMTEACLITCNPLPPRVRKPGSVGVVAGPEVRIIDADGAALPQGATGEIVIRGPNVVQGYEHDVEASSTVLPSGWLRTGDLGFFDADGYLFLTGRLKEIINRGGEKIAPPEVEQVLASHPAVAQAVAFAVPHARLGEDIAAAVVLQPRAQVTASDLRQLLATHLATFKVPQHLLIVDDIPKGPTGKIQRRHLAAAFGLTGSGEMSLAAPRTPIETQLVDLSAALLGLEQLGIHDNFFAAGGDSLLATQLISRVREVLHVDLPLASFFQTPTVAGMSASLAETARHPAGPGLPPVSPAPRHGPVPLAYAQQRLWFLEQLGLSGHAYTLLEVVRLSGQLDVAALEQSLQEIIRRHDILRTTFVSLDGQPSQIIASTAAMSLPVVDLHALSAQERQAQIHAYAHTEVRRPFDLAQGPLLRAVLLRLSATEHVLLLTMHHIVSDGWSHRIFWQELAALYRALIHAEPLLPTLPLQYADFALWQQQWLQGDRLDTLLAYWQQQLTGATTLQLPTDHPRPGLWTSRGARYRVVCSLARTQQLKALSQQYGVTLFMTLLAALQTLLLRYTEQDDMVVGTLIANRNRREIEGVIGFFVNTLALRTNLSGNPRFSELLGRVRQVTLEAYSHQDLPFEKLLEVLRPTRQLNQHPLLQVLFVLHNTPRQVPALPDVTVTFDDIDPETSKFDLTLNLVETPEGLQGWFEYSTDLFEAATIARMAGHFQTLLAGIIAAPEQRLASFPLLSEAEHQQLCVTWNATHVEVPAEHCLHEVFAQQAARTPAAVALIADDMSITYGALERRANQLAHYLRTLGVGPEVLVGLSVARSCDMVVGLLGILKAGGAYVPLDPTYPQERLAFMLEDAQLTVVVTQEYFRERLPASGVTLVCLDTAWPTIAAYNETAPESGTTPAHLAAVLYTSGSTGQPKGVLETHRATLNVLAWLWQTYPFVSQEVCCHKTSLSFVDSMQELLAPLLRGVPIVLIPEALLHDPAEILRLLAAHRVRRILLVPSLLQVWLETVPDLHHQLPSLRLWFVGGEYLTTELWQRFAACMPQCRLVNLYGTSEVSANATWYDTRLMRDTQGRVPIGHPIANTQVYVLDRQQQPVPIGVPGELYVGGAGLARGYLNRPALTAEQFCASVASDEPGARLYKTGDLARFLPDGALEFLGRLDHQVKVRGYRIELGEIETTLRQHPAIAQAVVLARQDIPGDTRLVAYVVGRQGALPPTETLQRFVKTTLPEYMAPATYVQLDTMPLLPNGKVDRQALPAPSQLRPALAEAFVAPRTPTEEVVAGIWATLLSLEDVGMHDDFFALGGHSLLAVQVVARLRHALQMEVPLRALFDTPTVASLAEYLESRRQTRQGALAPPIVTVSRHDSIPASMTQEHMWAFEQRLPQTPLFNISHALRLSGALNVAALGQSVNELVQRHEILRTTFTRQNDRLVQRIAPRLHLTLPVESLTVLPAAEQQEAVRLLASEEARQPFDVTQGPLLRVCLLQLQEQEHVLLVTLHHIVGDGWSLGILVRELAVVYEALSAGKPSPLPALPLQFADYACWQRQWQHSAAREAQLAYWTQQLQAPLPGLELPTDAPRSASLSFQIARQTLELSGELSAALLQLSRREGSTLFMTLLAACKVLLYTATGQDDLRVCSLVANRSHQDIEDVFGLFINTLLLRTRLGGNPTLREVLRRVRETTLGAYAHQDLPFEDLVRTLERAPGFKRMVLSPVMCVLQPPWPAPVQRGGLTLSVLEAEVGLLAPAWTASTFEIILLWRERPSGLVATCIYKPALFEVTTISRLLTTYERVLEWFVFQPEQPLAALDV
jgi:amino acid adenylation domain-containing protein